MLEKQQIINFVGTSELHNTYKQTKINYYTTTFTNLIRNERIDLLKNDNQSEKKKRSDVPLQ